MYGIINRSIKELVVESFGEKKWKTILKRSKIESDFFISNETYDDTLTYKLVVSVAEELGKTTDEVLLIFGEWWIIRTAVEKYPGLMQSGGKNLRDFLLNLPNFHNRIVLIYPELTPPEFKISDVSTNSLYLHYFSKRDGLKEFVRGLVIGIAKMYKTNVTIDLLQSREEGHKHEIFKVSW